jgi:hypothetical protein
MAQKRVVRSKADLLKDLRSNQDFMERMSFIKEKFYPALIDASKSIDDATSFLASINTIIMEDFLSRMKEVKLGDMKLADKLDPKDEKYEELKAMLALFDEIDVFKAKEYIAGMREEILLFLNEETKER